VASATLIAGHREVQDAAKTVLAELAEHIGDEDTEHSIAAFAQVSTTDARAREANFYLGLAAYYQGDFSRAQTAFNFVAARLPLPEVYNNLGIVLLFNSVEERAHVDDLAVNAW